eukprot:CAMPEP_0173205292 /NCGR_PEP_ID=MMETSP1141-20130122/20658_1 /TAXON_ID=483371 /ORGANISM="non described non described, Strain CCMP2298" /LENGTH=86 /DNA_ID=CAMNT_0014131173 /DNA_START=161 /DNA_END=418 /DNA_ORIENTATION=+
MDGRTAQTERGLEEEEGKDGEERGGVITTAATAHITAHITAHTTAPATAATAPVVVALSSFECTGTGTDTQMAPSMAAIAVAEAGG